MGSTSVKERRGCDYCADPLQVVLHEKPQERLTVSVALFRCPRCGTIILDDMYGWKGSGVVFHATPEEIEEYLKKVPGRNP